jgi:hypothetical protein
MKVTIDKKKGTLTIELPLIDPARPSSSGKNALIATTSGNKTADVTHNGKAVTVGCNVYIPN